MSKAGQPGDVDAKQLAKEFGCSPEGVRAWMEKKVEEGLFTVHTIRGRANKPTTVWRKVTGD